MFVHAKYKSSCFYFIFVPIFVLSVHVLHFHALYCSIGLVYNTLSVLLCIEVLYSMYLYDFVVIS